MPTLPRQVALIWNPRGDANLHTEVALLWSRPEDTAALLSIFAGGNHLASEVAITPGQPDRVADA